MTNRKYSTGFMKCQNVYIFSPELRLWLSDNKKRYIIILNGFKGQNDKIGSGTFEYSKKLEKIVKFWPFFEYFEKIRYLKSLNLKMDSLPTPISGVVLHDLWGYIADTTHWSSESKKIIFGPEIICLPSLNKFFY